MDGSSCGQIYGGIGDEGGKEGQKELLQLPPKQQLLHPLAAPPPAWTSQLVTLLLETGSESTVEQQPQEQQQQFETEEKEMVVDAGRAMVELGTREEEQKELLQLPPKQPPKQQQLQAPAQPPAVEDAGRHEHPAGESFLPFGPD